MKLAALKEKYQIARAKYEPDPGCRKCKGKGEYYSTALNKVTFCACLFIDSEFRDEALASLANIARQIKKEIQ